MARDRGFVVWSMFGLRYRRCREGPFGSWWYWYLPLDSPRCPRRLFPEWGCRRERRLRARERERNLVVMDAGRQFVKSFQSPRIRMEGEGEYHVKKKSTRDIFFRHSFAGVLGDQSAKIYPYSIFICAVPWYRAAGTIHRRDLFHPTCFYHRPRIRRDIVPPQQK